MAKINCSQAVKWGHSKMLPRAVLAELISLLLAVNDIKEQLKMYSITSSLLV